MSFDSLSQRMTMALKNIAGKGKLSEKNMDKMLKEVRSALLEADVNYEVTKNFVDSIAKESLGLQVSPGLDPAQEVVKIVHAKLVEVLGTQQATLNYALNGITVIMMIGLQGTGKTTSAAKIAKLIKEKQNRKPLLVAADIKRPAAIEQLEALGKSVGVEVFTLGSETDVITTVKKSLVYAKDKGYDTVIIDTAGRLAIDEELMKELSLIKKEVKPQEVLLTVDALAGQSIVENASRFDKQIGITGLMVTKFDSDARGGGVFSVRAVTDVPVKFVGTGEKMEDIDIFYPERMADRILGMGDVMTLIEQAQDKMDMKASEASAKRIMNGEYTMDDMLVQFRQVKKMGSISGILKMVPGMSQLAGQVNDEEADKKMKAQIAIILSMTPSERKDPSGLRGTHKNRIAKGSGTSVNEVNQTINNFERTKKQMSSMKSLMRNNSSSN